MQYSADISRGTERATAPERQHWQERFDAFRARGLRIDMTRGKPCPEQLALSDSLLSLPGPGDHLSEDGGDVRNYYVGPLGLPEARRLFSTMLDAAPEQVAIANNSSLALMHDMLAFALLHCVPGIGPLLAAQLFDVDRRLLEAYDDKSPAPPPRVRGEDETAATRARRGWCAHLFGAPWKELARYRRYLAGQSELATHQVVKGSEFEDVMVVMDDAQAGGFLISYDKLFGGKELSTTDRSRQDAGDETTIDRSLRLLYVTCSRARESLALVLWSANPDAALARLHQYQWFAEGEIQRIP